MSTKVPKKVKTLNKRGGVKSKHQEFAHDVPPSHRLSLADVHRTIDEEGAQPADTSMCSRKVEIVDGWPHILFKGDLCRVPTVEEVEEWVFDSVCFTPDEDEVEPDHPHSWLSILGLI